eukprot:4541124-Amphidinium_carterae.1
MSCRQGAHARGAEGNNHAAWENENRGNAQALEGELVGTTRSRIDDGQVALAQFISSFGKVVTNAKQTLRVKGGTGVRGKKPAAPPPTAGHVTEGQAVEVEAIFVFLGVRKAHVFLTLGQVALASSVCDSSRSTTLDTERTSCYGAYAYKTGFRTEVIRTQKQ